MKRWLAPVLVGLGVFLLALAVLLPTVVVPRVEKAPLDAYSVTQARGSGTFLDAGELELVQDDALTVTQVVRGDVEAGTEDVAVYDFSQTLESSQTDEPVNVVTERIVMDRSTGEGTGGLGDRPSHEGAHTVKFPFDTEKGEYLYHDTSAAEAFPVTFSQEVEIDGTTLYEFRGSVPETLRGSQGVPGALVGAPEAASTFVDEYYSNERSVLVEPRTGSVISTTNAPRRVWRPAEGLNQPGEETVVFEAELQATDDTVAERLDEAQEARRGLDLLGRTLPVLLGVLGLALLALGAVLLWRGERDRRGYDEDYRDDDDVLLVQR